MLTGVAYGVVNDMFACRECIEYFTVGHRYDGKNLRNRPIQTLNPTLNAIVWGQIATWHVCTIAGAVFAFVARVPLPFITEKVSSTQVGKVLVVVAPIVCTIAHFASKRAKKHIDNNPGLQQDLGWGYGVPDKFAARWHACNIRNLTGYLSIGVGGLLLISGMVIKRASSFSLGS
ncbi:hypothetical protein K0U07_00305 [bacterium]|nr:hypothetical protein [bacterium]